MSRCPARGPVSRETSVAPGKTVLVRTASEPVESRSGQPPADGFEGRLGEAVSKLSVAEGWGRNDAEDDSATRSGFATSVVARSLGAAAHHKLVRVRARGLEAFPRSRGDDGTGSGRYRTTSLPPAARRAAIGQPSFPRPTYRSPH